MRINEIALILNQRNFIDNGTGNIWQVLGLLLPNDDVDSQN